MNLQILDAAGAKKEEIAISKEIFGVKPNITLLSTYVRVYLTNQRQGTSSTKTRGEVSGGGKKPWRQKGTGRARVGSSRNPLWTHGGISHGPKPKKYKLRIPKKINRLAMLSALSTKYSTKNVISIDKLEFIKPSTKKISELLKKLNLTGKTLIVSGKYNVNLEKSVSNIRNVDITNINELNVFNVLNCQTLLIEKSALIALEEKYK